MCVCVCVCVCVYVCEHSENFRKMWSVKTQTYGKIHLTEFQEYDMFLFPPTLFLKKIHSKLQIEMFNSCDVSIAYNTRHYRRRNLEVTLFMSVQVGFHSSGQNK